VLVATDLLSRGIDVEGREGETEGGREGDKKFRSNRRNDVGLRWQKNHRQ